MNDDINSNGIAHDNIPDEIRQRLAKYDNMLARQKANQANYRKNMLKKGFKTIQLWVNVKYQDYAKHKNLVPTVVYAPEHIAKRILTNGGLLSSNEKQDSWHLVELKPDDE
jgi:hypothetical protein